MSTAERLSFHGFASETPAPTPARASTPQPTPRPASDRGPEAAHRLHGAIAVKNGSELRVTSQPPGRGRPGRILIRRWHRDGAGRWWPVAAELCWSLSGKDAQTFARAVAEAAAVLAGEAKPCTGTT
jgi:hypothetical protein